MRIGYVISACVLAAGMCSAQTEWKATTQLEQYAKVSRPAAQASRFIRIEMSGGKVVKGAPYSATSISEFEQQLADGNRIFRSNSGMVYRDSEGRTRREQPMGATGLLGSATQLPPMIIITDPVAGFTYTLNPQDKTATKTPLPPEHAPRPVGGQTTMTDVLKLQDRLVQAEKEYRNAPSERNRGALDQIRIDLAEAQQKYDSAGGGFGGGVYRVGGGSGSSSAVAVARPTRPATTAPIPVEVSGNFKTESLGTKSFDAVVAEGTRTVTTVPAGQIGNERPIDAVRESWFSQQLQVTVFSQYSDPRTGTTTERLSGINLAEPPHSLFEIPADYTVRDGAGQWIMIKPAQVQPVQK